MNKLDFYVHNKKVHDLYAVIAVGNEFGYPFDFIENRISECPYFLSMCDEADNPIDFITTKKLLSLCFSDNPLIQTIDDYEKHDVVFDWIAELMVYLQLKTRLNFQTIFLYLGIDDAIKMFPLYHEMDFQASLDFFLRLREESSVISLRMKELKLHNEDVAKSVGLSVSMVNALRNRKRDITKINVVSAIKIAKVLRVDISTLLLN